MKEILVDPRDIEQEFEHPVYRVSVRRGEVEESYSLQGVIEVQEALKWCSAKFPEGGWELIVVNPIQPHSGILLARNP